MNIKWKGATLDPSGYGCANRDYVYALHKAGVNITIEPWNYEANHFSFYGEVGKIVNNLKNNNIPYNKIVHHYVPNNVSNYYEIGKYNIGYSTWETTHIPKHWTHQINDLFDLQLVPSTYNKKVYEDSGIEIPIKVIPHCFNYKEFTTAKKLVMEEKIQECFKFLSVFQWTERKNPVGLLKAYYTGFYDVKNVILIIKSYGLNRSEDEANRLSGIINAVKKELQLDPTKCPPVLLISDLLPREQLVSLYKNCDCFVLPSRSEGFGMPYAEACAAGLPIVAPNYGGHIDFLAGQDFSYLCKYQLTPVAHMQFPYYSGKDLWCEPDIVDFRHGMLYWHSMKINDPKNFNTCKKLAQKMVKEKLSYEVIGPIFKKIIEEVS